MDILSNILKPEQRIAIAVGSRLQ